jgi:hypothetical protein
MSESTVWFDQFTGMPQIPRGQWCARHWAPCPFLNANGIGATIELMGIFINEIAVDCTNAEELNKKIEEIGNICCYLGDDRMYEIWGRWGPNTLEVQNGNSLN